VEEISIKIEDLRNSMISGLNEHKLYVESSAKDCDALVARINALKFEKHSSMVLDRGSVEPLLRSYAQIVGQKKAEKIENLINDEIVDVRKDERKDLQGKQEDLQDKLRRVPRNLNVDCVSYPETPTISLAATKLIDEVNNQFRNYYAEVNSGLAKVSIVPNVDLSPERQAKIDRLNEYLDFGNKDKISKEIKSSMPKIEEAYKQHETAMKTKAILEQLKAELVEAKQQNNGKIEFKKAISLLDDLIKESTSVIIKANEKIKKLEENSINPLIASVDRQEIISVHKKELTPDEERIVKLIKEQNSLVNTPDKGTQIERFEEQINALVEQCKINPNRMEYLKKLGLNQAAEQIKEQEKRVKNDEIYRSIAESKGVSSEGAWKVVSDFYAFSKIKGNEHVSFEKYLDNTLKHAKEQSQINLMNQLQAEYELNKNTEQMKDNDEMEM